MIQIQISNFDNSIPLTTITSPDYSGLQISNVFLGIGTARFEVGMYDPKSIPVNLRKYNRVKIYDGKTLLFNGYINAWRVSGSNPDNIEVSLKHVFGIFEKRITGDNETWNTNAGETILTMLASTNAAKDTKIKVGQNLATTTINQTFKRQTLFKAWQQVANAGQVEFDIDANDNLNVVVKIGEDKSALTILRYIEDQNNANTIQSLDIVSQGDDMVNDLVGTALTLSSHKQDSDSQNLYGLLQKTTSFSDSPDQATLDKLTQDYLTQNKYPKDIPSIVILNDKIPPYSLKLGDIVRVLLQKGYAISVDSNYRITGLNYTFADTGVPEVTVTLSDTFTRNLIPDAVQDIKEMQDRISALERK